MNIVFRLDASVRIGSGHLMRCLALADALRARGARTVFILRCDIEALHVEIAARGHSCLRLPDADEIADWRADAAQTLACLDGLPRPDCLIVDHYGLDARWETLLRPAIDCLMAIDDLADRPHDCDILLDQNLNLNQDARYAPWLPAQCKRLLGPRFAMLRPEFAAQRPQCFSRDGKVRRVAVFFGSTDPGGQTVRTLAAIAALHASTPALSHVAFDVVVGSGNPQRDKVGQMCRQLPRTHFHCQITNMAQLMAATDLCIGAGGTALWERAVLGVPSLVIAIVDNQVSSTVAMAQAGALLYLGQSDEADDQRLQQALLFALANRWLLMSMSQRSLDLVDGEGLERVADCVSAACLGA